MPAPSAEANTHFDHLTLILTLILTLTPTMTATGRLTLYRSLIGVENSSNEIASGQPRKVEEVTNPNPNPNPNPETETAWHVCHGITLPMAARAQVVGAHTMQAKVSRKFRHRRILNLES